MHPSPSTLRSIVLACTALAGSLASAPARAQPVPTVTDPNRFAVTGSGVVRRLFHLAESRRIDFAVIGDSNTRNAVVSGHEDGMGRALSARLGCYATRVDPFIGLGSWAADVGGASAFGYPPFQFDGAPRETSPFPFPNTWFPSSSAYLPHGVALNTNYNGGLALEPDHPVGISRALRYHLTMYRWRTPTDGQLVLTARSDPFVNFAAGVFPTCSATPGLGDIALDIPSRPGDTARGMMIVPGDLENERATRGPLFGLWQRVEAIDQPSGIAYSPLIYQGGRSARAACAELNNIGPGSVALREWLRQVTRLQNAPPVLCIQILHGGNDTGDELPSVGPVGGITSSAPLGHADNLRGIINNLSAAWAGSGFDPGNLFFILGPYHPRGDRLDAERLYEQQWITIAGEHPSTGIAVRGTLLSTEQEFISMGWVHDASDYAHLSIAGYRGWAAVAVEALQRAACPGDFNHDRLTTVQDIFDFLTAYFEADPHADFDGAGGSPSVEDLFAFLAAWFEGC